MVVDQTLQDLVDGLSAELEVPVLLDDADLRPLAYSRQWGAVDQVRTASILSRDVSGPVRSALLAQGIAAARAPLRTRAVPALGMDARICVPVRYAGELCGYLWLHDDAARIREEAIPRACAAADCAGEALTARRPRHTWLTDDGPLLAELCSPEPVRAAEAIRARGLLPDGPYALLVAAGRGAPPRGLLARLGSRFSAGHVLVGVDGRRLVLVVALRDPVLGGAGEARVAERVLRALREGWPDVTVARSGVAQGLHEAGRARRQAELALRCGRVAWDELGADRLAGRIPDDALGDVPPRLAALLREEPALTATLAAFLDAAGDVPATAAALNLHRSGVYYRLRRAEELTGLDLARGDDRLLIHLAVRLAGRG